MSENKMSEVAKLLDVKIGEEFWLADNKMDHERIKCKYKITFSGLERKYYYEGAAWGSSALLEDIITGRYEVVKINPISVLDAAEKRYLTNIIKPFRKNVKYIIKNRRENLKYEYISIVYHDNTGVCSLNFPDFKTGTMYQNMIVATRYKLEELGL